MNVVCSSPIERCITQLFFRFPSPVIPVLPPARPRALFRLVCPVASGAIDWGAVPVPPLRVSLRAAGRVVYGDGIDIYFVCTHHYTACIMPGAGDRGCNWQILREWVAKPLDGRRREQHWNAISTNATSSACDAQGSEHTEGAGGS